LVDDADAYRAYHQQFLGLWEQSRELRRSDVRSAAALDAGGAERQS
jgi:hypothetical protein